MMVEMKVTGLTVDPFSNAPVLLLRDADNTHTLPIWVGILEASAISSVLEKLKFSRPMTHDLMVDFLSSMNVRLIKVEVNDMRDNVYYATIHMEKGRHSYAVDARPSDAIALALRTGAPIFVDEEVLGKSKTIDLRIKEGKTPEERGSHARHGSGSNWIEALEELSPEAFGKYKM